MKKSLIFGIISVMATVSIPTYGQGRISLDNYDSNAHPLVTYGPGSGLSGGVNSSYTIGLYWAPGNIVSQVSSDPSGLALPSALNGSLTLGTGPGSSGGIDNSDTFNSPGEYALSTSFNPGLGEGATVTVMLIAYNGGSSYANSTTRGHSTAFTMTTSVGVAFPEFSGDAETDGGFVIPLPEPSIFALAGMGAAALMVFRRKK